MPTLKAVPPPADGDAPDLGLLTVQQVAAGLGITEQTVRLMLRDGLLPAVRIGRRTIRIRRADLDQFIDSMTTRRAEG